MMCIQTCRHMHIKNQKYIFEKIVFQPKVIKVLPLFVSEDYVLMSIILRSKTCLIPQYESKFLPCSLFYVGFPEQF